MAFFLLFFCVSGLIMNHRDIVSGFEVSRKVLPPDYRIRNYNNGIIKGTVSMPEDSVLLFGNSGVWKSDRGLRNMRDFNAGLPDGVDNRNVRNMVRTHHGVLYCATQSGLYRHDGKKWTYVDLPDNEGRVSDVTLMPDSAGVVALSRSDVYVLDFRRNAEEFVKMPLKQAAGREKKVTLFKTVWNLHSGRLFGLPGVLFVDCMAVVIIFLCITGIVIFVLPYSIRRTMAAKVKSKAGSLKWNVKWHSRVGYWTIGITLIIAATGMCLRPPLMVPLVLCKTAPVPGTFLDSENPWYDCLRAIRWDSLHERWLLSTSEGFLSVDRYFAEAPHTFGSAVMPPVSPMGVNVFEQIAPGKWLIGSFSGMYVWEMNTGKVHDYFTGEAYLKKKPGPPITDNLVAGYSSHLKDEGIVVFDYYKGTEGLPPMPSVLAEQPMSLWNVAQEVHTGRIYNVIFGPVSVLYVFLAGLAFLFVLISGFKLVRRRRKR